MVLYVSQVLTLGCLLVLFIIWVTNPDPGVNFVRFGPNCNVGVARDRGGEIIIFNDAEAGPYTGSILVVGDRGAVVEPSAKGWGGYGIYYNSVMSKSATKRYRTFTINIWLLIAFFGAFPVWVLIRKLTAGRRRNENSAPQT